jgi:hypothetical protein
MEWKKISKETICEVSRAHAKENGRANISFVLLLVLIIATTILRMQRTDIHDLPDMHSSGFSSLRCITTMLANRAEPRIPFCYAERRCCQREFQMPSSSGKILYDRCIRIFRFSHVRREEKRSRVLLVESRLLVEKNGLNRERKAGYAAAIR